MDVKHHVHLPFTYAILCRAQVLCGEEADALGVIATLNERNPLTLCNAFVIAQLLIPCDPQNVQLHNVTSTTDNKKRLRKVQEKRMN